MNTVGVIGGSGLYDMPGLEEIERVRLTTPFGDPSDEFVCGTLAGLRLVFLPRHGRGHRILPSEVNFRANIYGMKQLGAEWVIAVASVGSLREEIAPGHLVVPDQLFDRTVHRASTFFGNGIVAHIPFADPFCPVVSAALVGAARRVGAAVHPRGTYVCMEGPQFSTVAESQMHRAWGGDLIGMTVMPEAKLAREAEISYALVALPTDYDCWRPHEPGKDRKALLEEIIGNLKAVTDNGIKLLRAAVPVLAERLGESWPCADALALAIWSDKSKVDRQVVKKLELLVGRYFGGGF